MFPIIAIGAAVLGVFAFEGAKASSDDDKKSSRQTAQAGPLPQSYIVTPIPQGSGRQLTPVESVRNWTF